MTEIALRIYLNTNFFSAVPSSFFFLQCRKSVDCGICQKIKKKEISDEVFDEFQTVKKEIIHPCMYTGRHFTFEEKK